MTWRVRVRRWDGSVGYLAEPVRPDRLPVYRDEASAHAFATYLAAEDQIRKLPPTLGATVEEAS